MKPPSVYQWTTSAIHFPWRIFLVCQCVLDGFFPLSYTICCYIFQADDAPNCTAPARPVLVEREEKPRQYQPQIQYDTYDDFERIYMRRPLEISLKMSVGAKKKGLWKL